MKNDVFIKILMAIFFITCFSLFYQNSIYAISFNKYNIDTDYTDPYCVYACDIDADGDIDVLGSDGDWGDDAIVWWENDGTPNDGGWIEHTIDSDFGATSIYACDVDADGDLDVLGADLWDNEIFWWENDGTPDDGGWTKHQVDDDFYLAISVYASDIDADGDMDIIGAARGADDIIWWENDGTPEDGGWRKHTVDGNYNGACSVYASDIDADGDMDIIGAAEDDNDITWWENDGTPTDGGWTEHTIEGNFLGACSVYACDIDSDGYIDILGAARNGDDITWWENDGTPEDEGWTRHDIDLNFFEAKSIYACDMDSDGDMDVLGTAFVGDDITWWENDGTPTNGGWTEHTIDGFFNGAYSVYSSDLDSDGDMDVLGAAWEGDDITWWESTLGESNIACTLKWSINLGFDGIDGVNPTIGLNNSTYNFEVIYINSSNKAPTSSQVWIDLNDDEDYDDIGEKIDMNYDSGSYNAGALYSGNLVISEAGDRKLKYRFDFRHNDYYAGDKPSEDHYLYVIEDLYVQKNSDIPGGIISNNSNNISVLAFKILDSDNHLIKTIQIGNLGTMVNNVDITNMKLWYDVNDNYIWDSSDVWINKEVVYNPNSKTYNFTNLFIVSGTNMVATIDTSKTGINDRTFQGIIDIGYIVCSNNSWNTNRIINNSSLTMCSWIKHLVDNIGAPSAVGTYDMDADGDLDILGAANGPDRMLWWENDGTPDVGNWPEHIIENNFQYVCTILALDIDMDGDLDVMAPSLYDDEIAWWENDGTPADGVWMKHTIRENFVDTWSGYASDLDADGDMDILGASFGDDDITWWENNSGCGSIKWTEHIIDDNFDGARSVFSCDLDSDGDMDVLGAAYSAGDIVWYENDGNKNFTKRIIDGSFYGAHTVYACDLDLDGNMDVLGASISYDDIVWWRNDGTPENGGWIKYTIDEDYDGADTIYTCDMDSDGDMDVLGTANNADEITWWENDGTPYNGGWVEHTIDENFNLPYSAYASDLDSDGDMDIIGAGYWENEIDYWENKFGNKMAACSLKWSDNSGFNGFKGVNPSIGKDGDTYYFEVVYINSSNKAPTTSQVWIDLNDDQDYDDIGEKIDLNYISGSYDTGALYRENLTINSAGDKRLKYKYYFKYNSFFAGDKPSEDHHFYVIEDISVIKNSDTPGGDVPLNLDNISVLAFKILDSDNHKIKTVRIANLGTMENSIDMTNVKLWYDSGSVDYIWDSGDTQIGEGVWNEFNQTYDFTNLSIPSGTNIIATIDTTSTGENEKTFRGALYSGYITCSNNSWNTNGITNVNTIIIKGPTGPYYVDDGPGALDSNPGSFSKPFRTIQKAVNVISSGVTNPTCYIFPGTYSETVEINSNNNSGYMTITKLSNKKPVLSGSFINNIGIQIDNTDNVLIQGLTVCKYNWYGVYMIGNSADNKIIENTIYSNEYYGIYLNSNNVDNNYILSNNIWGENQNFGIYINFGDYNIVKSNYIHNHASWGLGVLNADYNNVIKNRIVSNTGDGIAMAAAHYNSIILNTINENNNGVSLQDCQNSTIERNFITNNQYNGISLSSSTRYCYITKNSIYSNNKTGILIDDSSSYNNYILTNSIYGGNKGNGIYINQADDQTIIGNRIYNNETNGIKIINSDDTEIKYNEILNNSAGIYCVNSSLSIYLNSITNNVKGINCVSGSFGRFDKNNIFNNTSVNLINQSASFIICTNNWWGTTMTLDIVNNISNNGDYSNFTPYRLFGPYDITPDADIEGPQRVENVNAVSYTDHIQLTWISVLTNDFHHYNIYRSALPGTTNLSKSNIIDKIGFTNTYIDYPSDGMWYYHITGCDDNPIYTNESWYSEQVSVSYPPPNIVISQNSVEYFMYGSSLAEPLPGCTIKYGFTITNTGGTEAKDLEVFCFIETNMTRYINGTMTNMGDGIYATNFIDSAKILNWNKTDGDLLTNQNTQFYYKCYLKYLYSTGNNGGKTIYPPDPIYVTGNNFNSMTNQSTVEIELGKIYGGELITEAGDVTNQTAGHTNYYTNILMNRGNTPDTFQLSITSTNSNGFTGGHWCVDIQNLAGDTVTNTSLLNAYDSFSFRIAIASHPSATNGAYYEYRIAAQSLSNTSATNYVGDDGVMYGGTIGDGVDGPGYVNMNNDMIRLTIDSSYIPEVFTPSVPGSLNALTLSAYSIKLSWQDVTDETEYRLYRNITDNVNTAVCIADIAADQIEYTDENLDPRTTYYYWLKAFNGNNGSDYSGMVYAKTLSTYEKDLSKLIIGPCPFKPYDGNNNTGSIHSGITFDRLTQQVIIKVYTIHGQLVAELYETDGDGKYTWQVPESIASGVYICCITNPQGEKRVRKIMIIK